MTTIMVEENISLKNVKVKNITELYYFIINSPEFTEIGILEENSLSQNEKKLLEKSKKSKKSKNRINI